ncbi:MAG TPA: ABC transporter permease [Usitatibacter sp.]|jgi:lipopolysaccharide transport system permease protein|nr:ABC transporter permease [Usitatibacter sp.]
MQQFPISPRAFLASAWTHRGLIAALTRREVVGRYHGSMLGLAWSFFNPLLMLAVYTFVFSEVLKVRWTGGVAESRTDFAIILFAGLIVFGIFAECVNRAPTLVLSNPNYVKKVVFPLEILPWVALGSALFHAVVSLAALLLVELWYRQSVPWTAFAFPLMLVPLLLFAMGLAWLLASLGVFLRDVGQVIGVLTTVLMFVSPIFYPEASLAPKYREWLQWNPLTFVIEESRNALIFGLAPDWAQWAWLLAASLAVAWAGFAWFQKTRRGFADVM